MTIQQMFFNASGGGSFAPVLGTKAPVLGASGQSPFPATGWTSLVTLSADDANLNVAFPFNFVFNNTTYTSCYPGSNTYITFGAGSSNYSLLSASNPATNKIHIVGADNSWQRVSSITDSVSNRFVRIRYEGNSSTSGTPGSPGIVYEATFFSSVFTGGVPAVELLIGTQNRGTAGISGIYSASALLTGGTIAASTGVAANQSYVLVGNATGTTWTVYTGYYVGGTGY